MCVVTAARVFVSNEADGSDVARLRRTAGALARRAAAGRLRTAGGVVVLTRPR